ncbi:hypothetical protein PFISCL1PPCAC_430, partial [Pristionchus fissidentatus]
LDDQSVIMLEEQRRLSEEILLVPEPGTFLQPEPRLRTGDETDAKASRSKKKPYIDRDSTAEMQRRPSPRKSIELHGE